jgi:hypothetical protein
MAGGGGCPPVCTKSGNGIGRPKRIFDLADGRRLQEAGWSIERIAE